MSAAKMIVAALLLPALILAAVTAVVIWIVQRRRNRQDRGRATAHTSVASCEIDSGSRGSGAST